jgi:hypothetical protein
MKIGYSVRVRKGIKSPDYEELLIEGWTGRIVKIDENILTIELDSITLSELKEDYIIDSLMNGFEYNLICLETDEVETVNPRDSQNDTLKKQMEINSRYSFDEEEKRINKILKSDDISVNEENLNRYLKFLKTKLKTPCILTGMEDFDWDLEVVDKNNSNFQIVSDYSSWMTNYR